MAKNSKTSKSMTAIVIAIIVVLAAIGFVVYDEWSSHSKLFENEKFATLVSEVTGKSPASLSEKTLSDVKYLSVMYDAESSTLSVAAAGEAFDTAKYDSLNAKYEELSTKYSELAEDDTAELLALENELTAVVNEINALMENVKSASDEVEGVTTLDDIKYFTGVELLEVSGVTFTDSSVFEGMTNIVSLYAPYCGLTEINGLAGLDLTKVKEINLAGNEISDWSFFEPIAEKVTTASSYTIAQDDSGNYTLVPYTETLADKIAAEKAAAEAEAEAETEEAEVSEETTEEAAEESAEEAVEEVVEETTEASAEESAEDAE